MATPSSSPASDVEARIRSTAQELGVDPDFAARIGYQENRFRAEGTSPTGAKGAMQVMPETAKSLAPRYGDDNIRQGVGYLRDLQEMFADVPDDQRNHFVAAAYNAGPGRVVQLMEKAKKGGQDPYNIASLADHLPHETLDYLVKINEPSQGSQQAARVLRPTPTSTSARTLTRPLPGLGESLQASLSAQAQRAAAEAQNVGEDVANLGNPMGPGMGPEELDPTSKMGALGRTGRLFQDIIPLVNRLFPRQAAMGVAGETLARRTGLVAPETGEQVGQLAGGLSPLAQTVAPKVARVLSPTLRTRQALEAERATELAAQGSKVAQAEQDLPRAQLSNLGAGVGQAGQLQAQEQAGTQAQDVVGNIANRIQAQASEAAKTAERAATPKDLRLQPRGAVPERVSTSPIVGPRGEPIETIRPGRPATTVTEKDYSAAYRTLRQEHEAVADTVRDFDNDVTRHLAGKGPVKTTELLAGDRDLQAAILRHADPIEATLLEDAVRTGQPLSKMPYTENQIRKLGESIIEGRGIMAQLTGQAILPKLSKAGLSMADLGKALTRHGAYVAGLGALGGAKAVAGGELALLLGRLGLRTLDAVIASGAGRAALRSLAAAQPGSAYVASATGAAVGAAFGRRLRRAG